MHEKYLNTIAFVAAFKSNLNTLSFDRIFIRSEKCYTYNENET